MDEINQMAMDEYHRLWPKQIEQHPRLAQGGWVEHVQATRSDRA
jgi:hypothetical protein